jgi:hypothetical protein
MAETNPIEALRRGEPAPSSPKSPRWLTICMAALLGIVLICALLLPISWTTLNNPYVATKEVGTDILSALNYVRELDNNYQASISAQHTFKNLASVIALLIGAAAAAAAVLRAPQLMIIGLGAVGAVVFGMLQLFYNATQVTALTTARTKLACIEDSTSWFLKVDIRTSAEILNMRNDFANSLPRLQEGVARLAVYLPQLRDAEGQQADERAAALRRIDLVLARPPAPRAALNTLRQAQAAISRVQQQVQNIRARETEPLPPAQADQMTVKLRETASQLDLAVADLAPPKMLFDQLSSARDEYVRVLADSSASLVRGEQLAAEARQLADQFPAERSDLADYAPVGDRTAALVGNAVAKVQADLLQTIARSEATSADVQAIIAAAIGRVGQPPTIKPPPPISLRRPTPAPQPTAPSAKPPAPIAPPSGESLAGEIFTMFRDALDQARRALQEKSEADERAAEQERAGLQPVLTNDLPILQGATDVLRKAESLVDGTTASLAPALEQARGAYRELQTIDLTSLQEKVNACAAGTTATFAPRDTELVPIEP